ncbi:interferon-induced very large GTPase 1-like [Anguilla anguilla]|uniref:interferon-induced very large GTPase 1-like n=1 Tax=Anguilla anguilla TaxID=7936 RepID=UPI0015B27A05|nr:interferon-induced very large GTPase 1-like [Anguilla anguilla]
MSQVGLSISKTGGPAEVDDHLQWKSHLVTSNRTWSVIDRGTTLIPVWEILIAAHKDDFKDVLNLRNILMEACTNITKVNVEKVLEKDTNRVISAATRPQANLIQTELTTSMDEDRKVSSKVKGKGLQLIKENTNRVIYVTEFSGLTSILECAKEEVLYCRNTLSSSEKLQSAKIEATQTITLSLNSLCKTWRDNDQDEAELLVLSIITVLGYSMETNTFDHALNWKEINFLQTKLQHAYSMYSSLKDQCATRAQAYLLQTALTTSIDEDSKVPSKEKGKRLQLIKSHLQDKLSVAIQSAIENSHGDWQWLESALQAIVIGTQMNDRRAEPKDTVYKQANLLLKQVPSLSQIQITDEENTPENDTVCKKRDSFMNLLQKLGLIDSYPKKMSQANVLLIDTLSLSVNQPSSEKELSSHYLYKLTMLDYRARYMFIKHNTSSMDLEDARTTVDNDDFFDFGDNSFLDVSCTETQIHPMDVHMAVFHCANDFLRQYIVKKLSTCQFAIPFLVPDPCTEEVEFPFWVLRYISKSWQSNTNSTADSPGKYKSRKMSCTPVPVVSFIRLGESNYNSKSQILNGVISKQRHSVFFHRHCKGSTKDSLLMNGVVEIAWYCPGGKDDDIFDDCVAFLNLHGDAAKHQKQLEFLQAVSTVNVLLLSEHPLDEVEKAISQKLSKSPVPLICMFSGKELIQQSNNPTKVRLAAKNRNHAEFTEELILSIRQCIGENKQTTNIEMCRQVAIQQQFKVNEVHKTYQEGYEQAQTLISILKEESSSALKEKLLPLQGDLWHEWSRKTKSSFACSAKKRKALNSS